MIDKPLSLQLILAISLSIASQAAIPEKYTYAVVISRAAYNETGWKAVADALLKKHNKNSSRLFLWQTHIDELKAQLGAFMPTYIGFVAMPVSECNSGFVRAASRLARNLDGDPYGDAYWGVITGYTPEDALRAVSESLLIKTTILASSGIAYEPPLQRFFQAVGMPCESYKQTDYLFPNTNGVVHTIEQRPENHTDRVHIMTKWLNAENLEITIPGKAPINGPFDCIITGGHGFVNMWQMHYNDAGLEGYLVSLKGRLFGLPYSGNPSAIISPTPKLYWHVSNCLMGTPDSTDNWVYAAFHTGHAVQLFGFIPPVSAGSDFMAWGVFDRVTKFAGKYTLPQGHFMANNNAKFEMRHPTGQFYLEGVGRYMDSSLVYGDPAADVTFYDVGDPARAYRENFSFTQNAPGEATFKYTVTATAHDIEFGKGYCLHFRPVFFMPVRLDAASVSIARNDGGIAEITDNLVLWEMLSPGETLTVGSMKTLSWTAELLDGKTTFGKRALVKKRSALHCFSREKGIHIVAENIPAGKVVFSLENYSGKRVLEKHDFSHCHHFEKTFDGICTASGIYIAKFRHSAGTIKKIFTF